MSILDTFFILFESDASKLNRGLDETDKRAKKTTEDVKSLDAAAYKMGESFGRSLKQLGGAVLATMTLRAMSAALFTATDHADKLGESAERLDVAVDVLSAWGDAAKEAGGSTEGLISSIETFNGMLAMLEVTGKSRAAPFLKELGIDMDNVANKGKTAFELLPKIAEAMEGMGRQQSAAIGKKLGLDSGTIMLMQRGRLALDELIRKHKELGVVTKEQAEAAGKFNDQLDDMHHAFRTLWLAVSQSVLPALGWVADKFQSLATFIRRHSDFIVGLMIALGAAIAFYVVPPLYGMAAAVVTAFAPFLVAGAIVAGLAAVFALLYDDVMNFLAGHDSLIGQILTRWPQVREAVQAVVDVVKGLGSAAAWTFETMVSVLQIAFAGWAKVLGVVVEFSKYLEIVQVLAAGLRLAFAAFGATVGAVFDGLVVTVKGFLALLRVVIEAAKGIAGLITGALGGLKAQFGVTATPPPGLEAGRAVLGAASASPITSQTSNSVMRRGGDRSVTMQTGPITIQTQATDGGGVARSLGNALSDELSQAASNFDDGVAA